MKEKTYKVYLSDWLYNAGIVGSLKILLSAQRLDKQNADFGNKIILTKVIKFFRMVLNEVK